MAGLRGSNSCSDNDEVEVLDLTDAPPPVRRRARPNVRATQPAAVAAQAASLSSNDDIMVGAESYCGIDNGEDECGVSQELPLRERLKLKAKMRAAAAGLGASSLSSSCAPEKGQQHPHRQGSKPSTGDTSSRSSSAPSVGMAGERTMSLDVSSDDDYRGAGCDHGGRLGNKGKSRARNSEAAVGGGSSAPAARDAGFSISRTQESEIVDLLSDDDGEGESKMKPFVPSIHGVILKMKTSAVQV